MVALATRRDEIIYEGGFGTFVTDWKKPFILVGIAAFTILGVLAATSTQMAIRRLGGRRWKLLHRLVYVAAGLVLVVLTGALVAYLVGPENIDFSASEIAGRTRPTLYDLAVGDEVSIIGPLGNRFGLPTGDGMGILVGGGGGIPPMIYLASRKGAITKIRANFTSIIKLLSNARKRQAVRCSPDPRLRPQAALTPFRNDGWRFG